MDALGIALWSVYTTDSFDEAIERSANILGNADSTTSITGQIAGAFYGYSTIDKRFLEGANGETGLNHWDDHNFAVRIRRLSQCYNLFLAGVEKLSSQILVPCCAHQVLRKCSARRSICSSAKM